MRSIRAYLNWPVNLNLLIFFFEILRLLKLYKLISWCNPSDHHWRFFDFLVVHLRSMNYYYSSVRMFDDVVHFVVGLVTMMRTKRAKMEQLFVLKVIHENNTNGNSCLMVMMVTVCLMNHYIDDYSVYD